MSSKADFYGWLGALLSIGFFAAPIYKYYNLIKNKIEYKEINIFIIVENYINCFFWLIYGYEVQIKQIRVSHSLGIIISFFLLWIYLSHMEKEKRAYSLLYTALLTSLTFAIYAFLIIINDKKNLREICCIFCTLIHICPTPLLIKAYNSKNYKIIPIYTVIFASIIDGIWTIFGFMITNANVIIPNLIGLIFTLAQIILYHFWKYKYPLTEELDNINSSIGTMKKVVDKTVELTTYPKKSINDEPLVDKDLNNNDNEDFVFNENNNKINNMNEGEDNETSKERKKNNILYINDNEDKDNDNEKLI